MAASFDDLPIELVYIIVKELKLDDIRALRLTSTAIRDKIRESSFKEYFRKKLLYLGTQHLLEFVTLTRESNFPCLVKDLTLEPLWCEIADDIPNKDITQLHGLLLGQALNNIRIKSRKQNLRSLSFEVKRRPSDRAETSGSTKPRKARSDRNVWVTRTEGFQVAVIGLIKTKMPSLELDLVFHIQRCALSCGLFPTALNNDLSQALPNVRRLSLRFSDAVVDSYTKRELAKSQDREINQDDWIIRGWLKSSPAVEDLEVEWSDVLGYSRPPLEASANSFFSQIGGAVLL